MAQMSRASGSCSTLPTNPSITARYGTSPKPVASQQQAYYLEFEAAPINFLRLSAQVYVSMDDVRWLAEVVPKLVAEYAAQGPGAATSPGQGPL